MKLAQETLRDFWASLPLNGDPDVVRALLTEFYPELVSVYGDTAAVVGADYYDMLRKAPPSAASFSAVLAGPAQADQAASSARWALGPLFAGDPAGALALLDGATQRLVMQPARDSIFESARRDPIGVRFARVPQGATCRFCTMVASRGFVYASKESAGQSNRWHDNCDCAIVPGSGPDDYPEGFDVETYRAAYRSGAGIGRDIPADP